MKVSSLAQAIGATIVGDGSRLVRGLTADSRLLQPHDVFVAIDPSGIGDNLAAYGFGGSANGYDFIGTVVDKGCGALIIDEGSVSLEQCQALPVPVLIVDSAILSLARFAKRIINASAQNVIVVTGSSGKTTTVRAIERSLCGSFQVWRTRRIRTTVLQLSIDTINNLTTPLGALIIELQASMPGDIEAFESVIEADFAVITSVSPSHLSGFSDVDGVLKEKTSVANLLKKTGRLLVNVDNEYLLDWAQNQSTVQVTGVGTSPAATFRGRIVAEEGRTLVPKIIISCDSASMMVRVPIVGRHVVYAISVAVTIAMLTNCRQDDIRLGIEGLRPAPGRMNLYEGTSGCLVIDDTYNANPESFESAICYVRDLLYPRKVAIVGGMAELKEMTEYAHRKLGQNLRMTFQDIVCLGQGGWIIYDEARSDLSASVNAIRHYSTLEELTDWAAATNFGKDTVVLVKGSRNCQLERVVLALVGRAHSEPLGIVSGK